MKRREIRKWYEQRIARTQHDCAKCGTVIQSTSLYERTVFALPKRLEPEAIHIRPPCARAYYTGK